MTIISLKRDLPFSSHVDTDPRRGVRGTSLSGEVPGRYAVSEPAPNKALHLTAYSLRSCVAPASGSR